MAAVFKWERVYRRQGIDGLRSKKPTGRPLVRRKKASDMIPELLNRDPHAFGFFKGRWVVRDISKALEEEGVEISPTRVHSTLSDIGLSYKRPKLDVKSDDPSLARTAREIRSYKQVAPALEKGGSCSIRGRDLALALPEGRGRVDASRRAEEGPYPGYNKRRNMFITLFWPKKNRFVLNTYPKRRGREYKLHFSNILQ